MKGLTGVSYPIRFEEWVSGKKWISWIMECISSVWFSILINGSLKGAQRGLRQGNPLSSFLLVIIGEALSHMVSKAALADMVRGFKPAPHAPLISYLQFADDTIIFCKADEDQVKNVKTILLCFEAVSGMKVNFFKSELLGEG